MFLYHIPTEKIDKFGLTPRISTDVEVYYLRKDGDVVRWNSSGKDSFFVMQPPFFLGRETQIAPSTAKTLLEKDDVVLLMRRKLLGQIKDGDLYKIYVEDVDKKKQLGIEHFVESMLKIPDLAAYRKENHDTFLDVILSKYLNKKNPYADINP